MWNWSQVAVEQHAVGAAADASDAGAVAVQGAQFVGDGREVRVGGKGSWMPGRRQTRRPQARTAGALYLINILFGAFAIGVVPAVLIVPDVATTAHNIQAHELLYRFGLAAHVVVTLTNIPGVAAHLLPWIGLPTIFGEGSLCLWLLIVGVDVERWKERASVAVRMRSTQAGELS